MDNSDSNGFSRRRFIVGAGSAGLLAATSPVLGQSASAAPAPVAADGTPEQIHLTWGADPSASVVVSWASAAPSTNARVSYGFTPAGGTVVLAVQRTYTDGLNGEPVFTYHATLAGLQPGSEYHYIVTSDNDANTANPFAGTFRTADSGRHSFRFTSFGDLATPNTAWVLSYGQSTYAVAAVESFNPLFHLLNGDLCYANLNPAHQPEVWRDFNNNNQASAANRPWMPCPGNHELEFDNSNHFGQAQQSTPQGLDSYLTRYTLPDNGVPGFAGRWYSFRVGSALFVSLSADDVIYQDGAAFVAGPASLTPAPATGNPPIPAGTSLYVRGYSGGAQTAWLHQTLAAARADRSIDWIIVQMHQDALSSSIDGNGSDLGIRQEWLPLFDQYQVDLVVCGHDHDYERSYPVRGADHMVGTDKVSGAPVETLRPRPVMAAANGSTFDTSQGTVHLILGGGGTSVPLDQYGLDTADNQRQAKVFTKANRPMPSGTNGAYTRAGADALEDAIWSANRDPDTGYGIAVFDLEPGTPGGNTYITVSYFHATGADPTNPNTGAHGAPNPNYTLLETFSLVRLRADAPNPALPEFATPAMAAGGVAVLGAGALYLSQRSRTNAPDSAEP